MATEYESAPNIMESIAEVHVHDLTDSEHTGDAGECSLGPSSRNKFGRLEIIFHQGHRIHCVSPSESENDNEEILLENKTLYALVEKLQSSYDNEKLQTTKLTQELESCKNAPEIENTEHKIKISELKQKIIETESIIAALQDKINDLLTKEKRESQIHESQVENIKNQCTKETHELSQQLEEARLNEILIKSQMSSLENKYIDKFKGDKKELDEKIEEKEKIINKLRENLEQVTTERDSALQRTLQLEDALRDSRAELRDKLSLSTKAFDDINKKAQTLETELENQRAVNENQRGSIEHLNVELHSATEKARASECEIVQFQDRSKHREQDLLTEITELKQECNKYVEQLKLARRELQDLREMSAKEQESMGTQNSIIMNELNVKILDLKKANNALTEELKDMIREQNNYQQQNLNAQEEIKELKEECNEKESILSNLATQNETGNKYGEWVADRKSSKPDEDEVNEINDLKLKLEETENSLVDVKNELSRYKAKYDENKKKLENYRNEIKEKNQYLQEKNIENVGLKLELDSCRQNKPISYSGEASERRVGSVKSTKSRRNSSRADCYSSGNSQSSLLTRRQVQSHRRRTMRHGSDFDLSAAESLIQERTKVTTLYRSTRDIFPFSVYFTKEEKGAMRVVVDKVPLRNINIE